MDSETPHISVSRYASDYETEYPNWKALKTRKDRTATYREFLGRCRRAVTWYEIKVACEDGDQEDTSEKGKCCGLHNGWYHKPVAERQFTREASICDYCYQEQCDCWKLLEAGMFDEYQRVKRPVGNPNLAQMNRDRAKRPEAIEPIVALIEGNIKTRANHQEATCRRKADRLIKVVGMKHWERLPQELQARLLEIYAEKWPE